MMTFLQPDGAPRNAAAEGLPTQAAPLRAYWLAAAAGLGALAFLHAALGPADAVARAASAVCYVAAAAAAGLSLQRGHPHAALGLGNLVTLARLVLVSFLAAFLAAGTIDPWAVVATGLVALALDGADGFLARRQRLASAFGARFDMEVDAAFALVLALLALAAGKAGPLVLVLGLARYVFVAAALWLPWLRRPLPERFSRKAVCVLQIATLVALQVPAVAPPGADLLVAAVAGALAWSFGHDIRWLWRLRGAA